MSSNTVTLVVSSVTGTDFATTGKHYRNATIIMLSDDILLEIFDMSGRITIQTLEVY